MNIKTVLIAVLLMGILPVAVQAQYSYSFDYENSTSLIGEMYFRTFSTAKVGHDVELPVTFGEKNVNSAIYKEFGIDGWDWDTGFYDRDYRPLLNAGETVIHNIYLWAGAKAPASELRLYHVGPIVMAPNMTYKLRLVQVPASVTYTGPTEWESDHGTITLPFYATDNPLTGYRFQATITAPVPEPSSLLALAGGLAGFGGFVLKRRR